MNHLHVKILIALAFLLVSGIAAAKPGTGLQDVNGNTGSDFLAAASLADELARPPDYGNHARNVILFVGDGMGIATVTASRIRQGQKRGEHGEENLLAFERLPYLALSKTYNSNQQTADSAGTMSAMVTGIKTRAGYLAIAEAARRADCASVDGHALLSLMDIAALAGLETGLVTTTRITHATPAAMYAKSPERNWESDASMPSSARAAGCRDIAAQLIDFPFGNGPRVVLGGGRKPFMRESDADPEYSTLRGQRRDGRNLINEWLQSRQRAGYVWNQAQFEAATPANTSRLLGLFEPSHMRYEADRLRDPGGEPSLAEMTAKAIEFLAESEKGYLLMVEGGRIDHAHHLGNAYRALSETIAFSDAVEVALETVDLRDTLIIVTADHSHVMTIGGYSTRGNPILGLVQGNDSRGQPRGQLALDNDGLPYTTLGYANGPGFRARPPGLLCDEPGLHTEMDFRGRVRPDLRLVATTSRDFLQEATVPLGAETHGGEDVPIYAIGPGSQAVRGVMEQNLIFHIALQAQPQMDAMLCQLVDCERNGRVLPDYCAALQKVASQSAAKQLHATFCSEKRTVN